MNQLAHQPSLYLRRHAADPIDWRVWGEAAFEEARRLNRPILLSVGFSACHWCHVMGRETFADAEVAAVVNALTVPIKVDRDERPDVDAAYQQAATELGLRRGWPLNLFLTPQLRAFAGGGYFGREALVDAVRAAVGAGGPAVAARSLAPRDRTPVTAQALDRAAEAVLRQIDPLGGGLRGAPKFPTLSAIELLLRASVRTGDARFRHAAERGLVAMSNGGLFDHLAGGYARYSVDAAWRRPHFEKMLGDNARFISVLTLAWRSCDNPLLAARIEQTIGWLADSLALGNGAFAASLAAEAGGVDGGDQIWTWGEVEALLGAETRFFSLHYALPAPGAPGEPMCRLRAAWGDDGHRLEEALARLREARARRARPERDERVLTDWNALTVRALAEAALVFETPDWLRGAKQAFTAIATGLDEPSATLPHALGGEVGLLEDYASVGLAALALHEAEPDAPWLAAARSCAQAIRERFTLPGGGLRQSLDATLCDAPARIEDPATPSGPAQALELFAKLSLFEDDPAELEAAAHAALDAFGGDALADPAACAGLLNAADTLLRLTQATVQGANGAAMRRAVLALADPAITLAFEPAPWGVAEVQFCRARTCGLAIRDPDDVQEALAAFDVALRQAAE